MAVRIKTHWFQEGRERGPSQQASVMAAAIWKTAVNGLNGLRKAKFAVDVGPPYIAVLTEFVLFLAAVADRIAYLSAERDAKTDAGWREAFTVALARRLADIYRDNLENLVGPWHPAGRFGTLVEPAPGGYAQYFIALLNERMAEYADFDYADDGPAFAFTRYFGSCIEEALPDVEDRKWALDQIMAVQAPEAIEIVARGMRGILGDPSANPRGGRPRDLAGD